jgi:chromosome segregation ATPase
VHVCRDIPAGGERSFTTVAFILALGEYTESPFRAMDEFDVFMDAINRRIATQTLLEFAREKGHLQFVFLTPQVGRAACSQVAK